MPAEIVVTGVRLKLENWRWRKQRPATPGVFKSHQNPPIEAREYFLVVANSQKREQKANILSSFNVVFKIIQIDFTLLLCCNICPECYLISFVILAFTTALYLCTISFAFIVNIYERLLSKNIFLLLGSFNFLNTSMGVISVIFLASVLKCF